MKHILYLTTNNINNKEYTGIHSTENINDNYLGSGDKLKLAFNKYGKKNFSKLIMGEFRSRDILSLIESWIVDDEYISSNDNYNICLGGVGGILKTVGKMPPSKRTKRQISDANKGKIVVKDIKGNITKVSVNDKKYLEGDVVPISQGEVTVYDKYNNKIRLFKNDSRIKDESLKMKSSWKGKVSVKDIKGDSLQVNKNDERILSGELVGIAKGNKLSSQVKDSISLTMSKKKWIKNDSYSKRVIESELIWYLSDGWKMGRIKRQN
ncbi:MAG: hypothetical protein KAI79_13630 [Bacteroidales bacterium]|nr:hypothetical protein [Bacteroidales bacterium]